MIEESGKSKNIKHVIARLRYKISKKTYKNGELGTNKGGVVLASIYEDVEQTSIRSQIPHHQTSITSPVFVSQLGCGQAYLYRQSTENHEPPALSFFPDKRKISHSLLHILKYKPYNIEPKISALRVLKEYNSLPFTLSANFSADCLRSS